MAGRFFQFEALQNASNRFGTLRNALRCDLVAAPFIGPPRPQWQPHSDHTATTQGYTGATRVPVKTGQRHPKRTVAALILLPASANHCKTLQSASICFKAPCKKMQYFTIECFKMLHFVSFTPVHRIKAHTCGTSECGSLLDAELMAQHPAGSPKGYPSPVGSAFATGVAGHRQAQFWLLFCPQVHAFKAVRIDLEQ